MLGFGKLEIRQVEILVEPPGPVPAPNPAPVPAPDPVSHVQKKFVVRPSSSCEISCQIESFWWTLELQSQFFFGINLLLSTDGSQMVCSGSCIIPLIFSCGTNSKVYFWNFQLAPVSVPLLGADFLHTSTS